MQRVRLWFSCSVCDYDLETSQRASELSVTTTTTGDVHVRTRPVEGSGSAYVHAWGGAARRDYSCDVFSNGALAAVSWCARGLAKYP